MTTEQTDVSGIGGTPRDTFGDSDARLPRMSLREWMAGSVLPEIVRDSDALVSLEDEDMKPDPEGYWLKLENGSGYYHVHIVDQGLPRFSIATYFEDRCARAALRYADALLARIRSGR